MEDLFNSILVEVVKVVMVTIMGLAVPLLFQALRRAGIQLSAEKEAHLNQIALIAAAEVEEWAAVKLKANLPVSSLDKMEKAVEKVVAKIPGVSEAEAKEALQAALPQIGLGAAAGLKELAKAVASKEEEGGV